MRARLSVDHDVCSIVCFHANVALRPVLEERHRVGDGLGLHPSGVGQRESIPNGIAAAAGGGGGGGGGGQRQHQDGIHLAAFRAP